MEMRWSVVRAVVSAAALVAAVAVALVGVVQSLRPRRRAAAPWRGGH